MVKLLQNGFMEALADAIGLRMTRIRLHILKVIKCQIELVVTLLQAAAEFGTTISQDTEHPHALFGKEGQYSVIQQIRCGNRRLSCVKLSRDPLRIVIEKGLLANAPDGS